MAKAPKPGKGYLNTNKGKQGMQPDFKGHILLARSYQEGETFHFGAWHNDYNGFNLTESKPMDNQPKQEYPRPVSKYNDDDPNSVPF
jgi:hypothetical protein